MRLMTKEVYTFDELSDQAKEKARDWMRECQAGDNDLSERNYDDFETVVGILGIDLKQRNERTVSGKTYSKPCIWWSGFCSQGDGLCFEGTWSLRKESIEEIKAHAPQDTELHRIAEQLWPVMMGREDGLTATITHSGHYYHENSVDIEISLGDDDFDDYEIPECEQIKTALKDLMRWMYARLDEDNDYLNSDECIDEAITCNEYEFDGDGGIV